MTKEEAEDDVIPLEITGSVKVYNQAYVDKQEKRIAELEKENARLTTNEKSLLAERKIIVKENTELEAQIEKMKCCQNCLHLCARCELGIDGCYVCSKWELRR